MRIETRQKLNKRNEKKNRKQKEEKKTKRKFGRVADRAWWRGGGEDGVNVRRRTASLTGCRGREGEGVKGVGEETEER